MNIRGHWSVLLTPFIPLALGLYLLSHFGVTPGQTLAKIQHVMSRQPPVDWTIAIDLAVWLIIGFGLFVLAGRIAWLMTTRVEVMKNGIEHRTGVIHRYTSRIQFKDAESLSLYQSWLGYLLGYGTVTVHGRGSAIVALKNVATARDLMLHIDQQMARTEAPAKPAPTPASATGANTENKDGMALAG
ncbi:PH domain-containing protein [Marinobacter lacisalsi]|uniref:PH domain-containing protein n=1 Tax=Marinobacter lacisalsi TaxID=475979 RepID=A0ABV8QH32_9GAMM